jgi:hypothetical protein
MASWCPWNENRHHIMADPATFRQFLLPPPALSPLPPCCWRKVTSVSPLAGSFFFWILDVSSSWGGLAGLEGGGQWGQSTASQYCVPNLVPFSSSCGPGDHTSSSSHTRSGQCPSPASTILCFVGSLPHPHLCKYSFYPNHLHLPNFHMTSAPCWP